MNKILRLPEVTARTGLSRATIYLKIQNKDFPEPVSLGARAIGWKESDISEWIESLSTTKQSA